MKKIEDVRHQNLLTLIEEYGSIKKLADVISKSESQISQWKARSPDSKSGKPRNISSAICREIEKKTSKPFGWMDTDHSGNATHVFERDNELTEKAEIETLKAQARAETAEAQAEIARREAETAKMQARAEIAEAKLEILKPQAENFQLVRDLLKRTEARLTETEKVLNEMQEELITIKKNSQRVA